MTTLVMDACEMAGPVVTMTAGHVQVETHWTIRLERMRAKLADSFVGGDDLHYRRPDLARRRARAAMVKRYVLSCEYRCACLEQMRHAETLAEMLACAVDAAYAARCAHRQWRAIQRLS